MNCLHEAPTGILHSAVAGHPAMEKVLRNILGSGGISDRSLEAVMKKLKAEPELVQEGTLTRKRTASCLATDWAELGQEI